MEKRTGTHYRSGCSRCLKATAYEKLTACKDRLEMLCRENTLFRSIGLQFDFN